MAMRIVLASNSPRRRDVLRAAGIDFDVQPSAVQEHRHAGEGAEHFAKRMAMEKALDVARSVAPDCLVLGADTVVTIDSHILGKPASEADAVCMLKLLSGRTHKAITGVSLVNAPDRIVAVTHETTGVTFSTLDEDEILAYVRSGEPLDKAGAYGIQGLASRFVTRIDGCYSNVVGLPVAQVYGLLKAFGQGP